MAVYAHFIPTSAIVPLRGIMPAGRLGGSTSSAVSLVIITGCPPYAVVYRRRLCFSGRRRTHLEQSAAARHVCTLAPCFSQSSEDASLQTLLSMNSILFFVVPVKWLVIIGHVNRSFYLLTYFSATNRASFSATYIDSTHNRPTIDLCMNYVNSRTLGSWWAV